LGSENAGRGAGLPWGAAGAATPKGKARSSLRAHVGLREWQSATTHAGCAESRTHDVIGILHTEGAERRHLVALKSVDTLHSRAT